MIPDRTISLPSNMEVLKLSLPFVLPLIVLVWLLIVLRFPITSSVSATILTLLLCTQLRKKTRFSGRDWVDIAVEVGRVMCTVGIACAAANVIIASVFLTGMTQRIAMAATTLAGDSTILLLLVTAIGCYILGMGSGALVLYITVALLIVPALIKMGIVVIAAHLFAYMMACTAFITPPVALNCYAAAPLAGASPMRIGWQSMKLGIIIYIVPFVFCFRPGLLAIGTPLEIITAVVAATAGSLAISFAIAGHLFKNLNWFERGVFALVALALFMPNLQLNIIGAGVGIAMALWLRTRRPQM